MKKPGNSTLRRSREWDKSTRRTESSYERGLIGGNVREDLHFRLRIPGDLKKLVEAHASLNGRSMTAEIISRLAESFDNDAALRIAGAEIVELRLTLEARLSIAEANNKDLQLKIAELEGYSTALKHGQTVFLKHLAKAAMGDSITYEEIKADLNDLTPQSNQEKGEQ